MSKTLTIQNTTKFSQIFNTFGDGAKKDFGMRFDGNVIYTHGKYKLHGLGQQAATQRAQRKADAGPVIKNALTQEYGADFAQKVMVRLRTDRGLDLRQGVTRGQLTDIHQTVRDMQKEMLSSHEDGFRIGDSTFLKENILKLHTNPQALRAAVNERFTPDKVRSLVSGNPGPVGLSKAIKKHLIAEWTPPQEILNDMTPKEIREMTRNTEKLAAKVTKDAMREIYAELGLEPKQMSHCQLNEHGMARLERLMGLQVKPELTAAEVQTLASFDNNPAGLKNHLDANPELGLKLLNTPQPQLELIFDTGVTTQGFDAAAFLQQLATAGGFQLDPQGLSCDAPKLTQLLQDTQAKPGVKADFAYRVQVEAERLAGGKNGPRIGGETLVTAINNVYKGDVQELQKLPPYLQVLTRAEMTQVASRLNNPAGLKNLMTENRPLMIKLATTHPEELRAHMGVADRGGLSVDDACRNLLAALPGSDATKKQDGRLDTVTVQGQNYTMQPGAFGEGGYGDIFLMENGNQEKIVLKRLKPDGGESPEMAMRRWQSMSNEVRVHSHLSRTTDNVVKFLEPVRVGDELYMAMECCEGGSLSDALFYDGVGQLAKKVNMDPRTELALKLSYMSEMLEPLSFIGENVKCNHHDVKAGNFFLRGDGSVALADFGTLSVGARSNNFVGVQNAEQHSPESMASLKGGPPYAEVTHASDCFAFGVLFSNFVMGKDIYKNVTWGAQKQDLLMALHEHRGGFFMPPQPVAPQPPVGLAQEQYLKDLEDYNKMDTQKKLIELAGFTIADDGSISLFDDDDGNPLKELVNQMLSPDPAQRSTAIQSLLSGPMQALFDPDLQKDLKDLRALVGKIKVNADKPNDQQFTVTPQDQQQIDLLSDRISKRIGGDQSGIWQDMGV